MQRRKSNDWYELMADTQLYKAFQKHLYAARDKTGDDGWHNHARLVHVKKHNLCEDKNTQEEEGA